MKEHPNYYAILPAPVRYSEALSPIAKILYAEITALSQKEGFCWATNEYFAKLFHVSKNYVSAIIQELEKEKTIKIVINKDRGNKRKIYPNVAYLKDFEPPPIPLQCDRGIPLQCDRYNTTVVDPTPQKCDSSINNTRLTIINNIHAVFAYFCEKTGKKLKLTADRSSIIKKRLEEGHTVAVIEKAIDNFIKDDWPDRANYIDIVYCMGRQRDKGDNLEKWLNWKPQILKVSQDELQKLLEEKLGRIATKSNIKKVMVSMPENQWHQVDIFLKRRYPLDRSGAYYEVERELIRERRESV